MLTMKKRLGEILLDKRLVDGGQLSAALAHQRSSGVALGQVMLDLSLCTQTELLEALADQTGVPALDLDQETLEPTLAAQIPRKMAERHRVVPLRLEGPRGTVLVVAIAAPASFPSLEAVRTVSNKSWVAPRLATDEAITRAIARLYGPGAAPPSLATALQKSAAPGPVRHSPRAVELPPVDPEDVTLSRLIERPARPVRGPARPPVLLYGWKEEAARALLELLCAEGHRASLATAEQVGEADEDAVVVAPLPWLETLRHRPRARLLVAGREPHQDGVKARLLGAQGFLVAPLDKRMLVREVERLAQGARAWAWRE